MDELKIRKAIRSDQSEILKLVRSENLNPINLRWENFLLGETEQNRIIAIVQLKKHKDGSKELASLVVQPENRGQGYAGKLIKALISGCDETIYLMCRSGLGPFYQQYGFEPITREEMPVYFKRIHTLFGLMKRVIKRDEDLLIMCKK